MTCGSRRGGRESKSATGKSSLSSGELLVGTGADDLFMQSQGAIFFEELANIFGFRVQMVSPNQSFDVLKVLEETMGSRVLERMELERDEMLQRRDLNRGSEHLDRLARLKHLAEARFRNEHQVNRPGVGLRRRELDEDARVALHGVSHL